MVAFKTWGQPHNLKSSWLFSSYCKDLKALGVFCFVLFCFFQHLQKIPIIELKVFNLKTKTSFFLVVKVLHSSQICKTTTL